MEAGYVFGRVVSLFLFPLLIMGIIGMIQYIRTKDKEKAYRAMFSWKSITLGIVLMLFGVMGQISTKVENMNQSQQQLIKPYHKNLVLTSFDQNRRPA